MLKASLILLGILALVYSAPTEDGEFNLGDCALATDKPGPHGEYCMALFRVYKWSNENNTCEEAFYSGCNPTNNNFKTLENCNRIAKPICEKK